MGRPAGLASFRPLAFRRRRPLPCGADQAGAKAWARRPEEGGQQGGVGEGGRRWGSMDGGKAGYRPPLCGNSRKRPRGPGPPPALHLQTLECIDEPFQALGATARDAGCPSGCALPSGRPRPDPRAGTRRPGRRPRRGAGPDLPRCPARLRHHTRQAGADTHPAAQLQHPGQRGLGLLSRPTASSSPTSTWPASSRWSPSATAASTCRWTARRPRSNCWPLTCATTWPCCA